MLSEKVSLKLWNRTGKDVVIGQPISLDFAKTERGKMCRAITYTGKAGGFHAVALQPVKKNRTGWFLHAGEMNLT